MVVTSSSYAYGGLDLQGYLDGYIPFLGSYKHYFTEITDVYGGYGLITTDDGRFILGYFPWSDPCQGVPWGNSYIIYGCDWGPWTNACSIKGSFLISQQR